MGGSVRGVGMPDTRQRALLEQFPVRLSNHVLCRAIYMS